VSKHAGSVSERVDLQEFLGAFVVEAEELVVTANTSLLEIEVAIGQGTSRPRAVRDLFRALHTIKGLASMIGVEPIVELAHALETLVRAADRAGGSLRPAAVEIALQGVGAISDRVRAVAERRAVAEPPGGLIEAITSAEVGAAASIIATAIPPEWEARLSSSERQQLALALQTRAPVWTLSFSPSEANAARGITITTVRAGLGAIGEIVKVIPRSIEATAGVKRGVAFDILIVSSATQLAIAEVAATDPDRVIAMVQPMPAPAGPELDVTDSLDPIERDDHVSTPGRAVVRVELARLDDLQDQLALLIVSRFRLEREIASLTELGTDVRRLHEIVRIQGRQLRDLRRAILRARMVRVAEVLEPLPLLVRRLVGSGPRIVQLEVEARDVELDKAVADRLLPALIHLVRNAVDHGIEPPEQRVALGKPRTGTVRVSCLEVAGNFIEVVVRDDGRGIDRAEIARRANRPIADDAGLLAVLTSPGFSTRDVATTTSGRGLGMDIVRRIAVGDLGGEISMTTHPDAGTAFTLRVPVTMSVMDVLSFQCGPQAFVVPALVVEEIIEVLPEMIVVPPSTLAAMSPLSLVARRDRAIPLVSLGAILAIDSGAHARKALVVRRNGEAIAYTVDRVIGRQEVVVRTIDDPLVHVPGIAGATDLGDGRPTLVLDLNELGIIARERGVS
jgi:two-component system chemotaxis sensor kinase CheA